MSEPSTAEVLPVLVTVAGQRFVWTPEEGLDPAAVTMMEPWIWSKAFRMRYPAAQSGYSVEDMVQEGRVGALVAARKYDPFHIGKDGFHSGCGFLTFAKFTMLQHMLEVLRHGDLTITKRQWEDMRTAQEWPKVASLDSSPINDTTGSLKDFLAAPEAPRPDRILDLGRPQIRAALGSLQPQDRQVLVRHFGLGNPDGVGETFDSIAADWGLSRQRIQQIEKRAQMRLRRALALRGVGDRW